MGEKFWEKKWEKIPKNYSKAILNGLKTQKRTDLSQPFWFRSQSAVNQTNYPSTFVSVGTPSAAATVTHITACTFPLLAMV